MPNPNNFDNKDDFFKVCIPQVIKEGTAKDDKQAVAICNSMWDKKEMKLETVNIGGVEIFETGNWKGNVYKEKDLDEFVNNFNNKVAEPYMTIDHSDKASKQFKDALQALSLGFVSKLSRIGKKLVADFKQVPKTIADLIQAGALKKKSIEFYRQFIANGNLHKNVLQGVTFHGANGLPEVNTLSDFLNLYKSNLQVMVNDNEDIVSLKNSDLKITEVKMSDNDVVKMKDEQIAEFKNQLNEFKNQLHKLQQDNEEKDKVIEEKEKEIADKEETIKEVEKEKEEDLKKEAENYVNLKISEGYLKPTHKDRYVNEYITYKKDDKLFADFKDDIEGRTKIINFGPTEYPENQNATNFKYDPEKMEYKAGATINYEELNKRIEAVAKAKNISWEEAAIECKVADKSEFDANKAEV
jgi:hypothetical protein